MKILVCLLLALSCGAATYTQISPTLFLFPTSSGNVIASVGADGAFLVGTPSIESTAEISSQLSQLTQSPVRCIVIFPAALDQSQGDAGWVKLGAFVAMHENALDRLGGHAMHGMQPLPPRLVGLGVNRPRIAFSEVLTFDMNGDSIHVVHQPPAYSNADAIVHFHTGSLIYMGEVFPGDGYPQVDTSQGGKLDGIIHMLNGWTNEKMRICPARGKVTTGADVKTFRDMIVALRTRVKAMSDAGKTEHQIIDAKPTAEFDGTYGHGRVTPDAFVREVYESIK